MHVPVQLELVFWTPLPTCASRENSRSRKTNCSVTQETNRNSIDEHEFFKMKHIPQCLAKAIAIALTFLVILELPGAKAWAQTLPTELNIVIVEGEGSTNQTRQRASKDPIVRIEDENHKPIAGAVVVFTLPTEGATGDFGNGQKTLTVTTDAEGRAMGQGLRVNPIPGKLPIHITASYRGLSARTNITQFDEGPPVAARPGGGGHGKVIALVLILGGAAGAGAAFGLKGKTSSAPAAPAGPTVTPIGITPGTGAITGPH
jgi:hypothetical protein